MSLKHKNCIYKHNMEREAIKMDENRINEMTSSSERLITLIRSLPESEVEKILFLVEGTRIGSAAAEQAAKETA